MVNSLLSVFRITYSKNNFYLFWISKNCPTAKHHKYIEPNLLSLTSETLTIGISKKEENGYKRENLEMLLKIKFSEEKMK